MKLLVASDIHGSAYYLKQLLEQFTAQQADKMLLLGDLLYHGPRNDLPKGYDPKACIQLLRQYRSQILAVRGNCDSEVDQMVLGMPILADYAMLFLHTKTILATHGHLPAYMELESMPNIDIHISGHTHIPMLEQSQGVYLLNPGSISLPKQQSVQSFGILQEDSFQLFDLAGKQLGEIRFE